MNILFLLLLSSILAFALNLGITPLLLYFAHKFKWYDTIDHRKIHEGDMPHIGGVGIVLSFILATTAFYLLVPIVEPKVEITRFGKFFPVLVGTLLIHITGLVDDFRPIRARYKAFAQIVAAIIVVSSGIVVTEVAIPYTDFVVYFGPFGYPITVLWLVGISNAVNLTDGLDGLAGGISAIAFLFMGLVGVTLGAWSTAAIAFAICAGTAGFLVFNKPPAKIFMGDSGALTLGFLLASVMIVEFLPKDSGVTLTVSLSFAAIPLSDTLAAIFRRIRSKTPIYSPDKEHTHHKLRDFGMSDNKILFIIYSLCILHGGTALAWVIVPFVGVFIAIAAVWLITLIFFIVLDRMYRGGLRIGNVSRD